MFYKKNDIIKISGSHANKILNMFNMCPSKVDTIVSFFNENIYIEKLKNLKKENLILKTQNNIVKINSNKKDILIEKQNDEIYILKNQIYRLQQNIVEIERINNYVKGKL